MTSTAEMLRTQLEQLSPQDRAELAAYLIDTLDEQEDPEAEAAWRAELARRRGEIESGRARGEAAASVFARLRAPFS